MTEKEWMQDGMDLKLYVLLLWKKFWIIIAAGIAAGIVGMSFYYIKNVILAPPAGYEAVSRYYLTFAYDKDGDVYDHYNAYTWNDLAASEPILDYTVSQLLMKYDREYVKNAVTCTMPSDYRVIETSVIGQTEEEAMEIALATEKSLLHFGEIMPEFSKIEVIEPAAVSPVSTENYAVRALAVSGAFGGIAAFLLLLFWYVLDTSVYLPEMLQKRFGFPVLSVIYQNGMEETQLTADMKYSLLCMQEEEVSEVKGIADRGTNMEFAGSVETISDFERLRQKENILLAVRFGSNNGNLLRRQLLQLENRNCIMKGMILYHADEKLYKRYYRTSLTKEKKV